jgi:hypothetical protein
MPKLSIPALIEVLEKQRVRLYEIYIDIVNVEMADRVLYETVVLEQLITTLQTLVPK